MKKAIILANGDYPKKSKNLTLIQNAETVVCCDGAANEYIKQGNIPTYIVGDCDSLLPEYKVQFEERIHIVSDQSINDQTKAVLFLKERGFDTIDIFGATGKREDHTLGNIFLLAEYLNLNMEIKSHTDYGYFQACRGDNTFHCTPRQQISIFNINAKNLKSKGLVYPIYDFTAQWQGTLNETIGYDFAISAEGDYIVFFSDDVKNF